MQQEDTMEKSALWNNSFYGIGSTAHYVKLSQWPRRTASGSPCTGGKHSDCTSVATAWHRQVYCLEE